MQRLLVFMMYFAYHDVPVEVAALFDTMVVHST
jgi:hypothetical protein